MAERQGRAPEDFLPGRVYRYDVQLQAVVDLTDPAARDAVQLRDQDLRADDLTACQAVGEAAQYLGREGILAPSAARDGHVLAVFIDRLQAGSVVLDSDYEVWEPPPTGE